MKRTEIERLLPGIFQRTVRPGNPTFALLEVMEALHAPSEAILDDVDRIFDPHRTPDGFLPFLARWVNLERLFAGSRDRGSLRSSFLLTAGRGRLRELIAAAADLWRWRGTRKGLVLFLETATGVRGFEISGDLRDDGTPEPFGLVVRIPAAAEGHEPLIERILDLEKPAHVTYRLESKENHRPSRDGGDSVSPRSEP
jgi:phage tail-like protein